MNDNYYEMLGVDKKATVAEIKSAYRKKALKWHPDKNKSKEAEKKFKKINQAYEVLSDPQTRQQYDQFGSAAFKGGGASQQGPFSYSHNQGPFTYTYSSSGKSPFQGTDFEGFSDPFEIFEQFFGFGASQQRVKQKPIYQIELTFNEAVNGVSKKVKLEGKAKTIKIPAGVDSNTRIRFSDFDILISVRPDPSFKRQGQDVYYNAPVSFIKAILGGSINVPTVDGKEVQLKIRPGTQPNTMLRLQGKGIPYPNRKIKGDQYIKLNIKMPEKISKQQKKILEEFEKNK